MQSSPKSQQVMGALRRLDLRATFKTRTGEDTSEEFATERVTRGGVNETRHEVLFLDVDI